MTTQYTQNNPGKLISDSAGYQIWCSTFKVNAVHDTYCVELYSVYKEAKKPDEHRTISRFMLSKAQLEGFQASLAVPSASV